MVIDGSSFRNVAKALPFLHIVKRSHVAVLKWIQKHKPRMVSPKRKKVSRFIIGETQIRVDGLELLWL